MRLVLLLLSGVELVFPMVLNLPAAESAVITAISLFTVPAFNDPKLDFSSTADLWSSAYGLFGYTSGVIKVRKLLLLLLLSTDDGLLSA